MTNTKKGNIPDTPPPLPLLPLQLRSTTLTTRYLCLLSFPSANYKLIDCKTPRTKVAFISLVKPSFLSILGLVSPVPGLTLEIPRQGFPVFQVRQCL